MSKDNGGPAFPRPFSVDEKGGDFPEFFSDQKGMTLRDYFAGKALPAVIVTGSEQTQVPVNHEIVAHICYEIADAMITERNKS